MNRLILTIGREERVFIAVAGKQIEVQLVRLGPEKIRLSFTADKSVVIDREAVHNKKKTAQQEESARIDVGSAARKTSG